MGCVGYRASIAILKCYYWTVHVLTNCIVLYQIVYFYNYVSKTSDVFLSDDHCIPRHTFSYIIFEIFGLITAILALCVAHSRERFFIAFYYLYYISFILMKQIPISLSIFDIHMIPFLIILLFIFNDVLDVELRLNPNRKYPLYYPMSNSSKQNTHVSIPIEKKTDKLNQKQNIVPTKPKCEHLKRKVKAPKDRQTKMLKMILMHLRQHKKD